MVSPSPAPTKAKNGLARFSQKLGVLRWIRTWHGRLAHGFTSERARATRCEPVPVSEVPTAIPLSRARVTIAYPTENASFAERKATIIDSTFLVLEPQSMCHVPQSKNFESRSLLDVWMVGYDSTLASRARASANERCRPRNCQREDFDLRCIHEPSERSCCSGGTHRSRW